VEEHSGPPPAEGTRDETSSTGRFTRDPGATRPEIDVDQLGPTPPAEAAPEQPSADPGEAEATPIMSNLPRTRPQQRSQKRPAQKRPAKKGSASTRGRKVAAERGKAGTASRGRSRAKSTAGRRSSAPAAAAPKRSGAQGVPRRAIGTAFQIAGAPLRLTARVTRRTANEIGRRLGL
jgi:hypothetical protein